MTTIARFESMSCKLRPDFLAYAAARLANHDAAEDAVQQAFMLAWEKLPDYEDRHGDKGMRGWLYTILATVCLTQSRDRQRRREADVSPEDLLCVPAPKEESEPSRYSIVLDSLLSNTVLTPAQREAIEGLLDGDSERCLGRRLGISRNAAKCRVTAAIRRLQDAHNLEEIHDDGKEY